MIQCAVAIGSNIQPNIHIPLAIRSLQELCGDIELSNAYSSKAVGLQADQFINVVALCATTLEFSVLKRKIKAIEQQLDPLEKRSKSRKIDIDILLYGNVCDASKNLPHEDITHYSFVACLLAELLPDGKHPQRNISYQQLCKECKNNPVLTHVEL